MAKSRLRAGFGALVAGILITIGGCSEPSAVADVDTQLSRRHELVERQQPAGEASYSLSGSPRVEQVIGPGGGTLQIPGGHTLAFPAGAVSQPTRIRAKADSRYVGVELEPHGLQFPAGREPVLTLSYGSADVSSFRQLSIAYVSSAGQLLEHLNAEHDSTYGTLTGRLRHFSRYVAIGS